MRVTARGVMARATTGEGKKGKTKGYQRNHNNGYLKGNSEYNNEPEIGDGILCCLLSFGALLCFFPLILGFEINPYYTLDIDEPLSLYMIASLAVAFPLSVDVILNHDLPWKVILSRWILFSSLIIPNLYSYYAIHQYGKNLASGVVICCGRARQILCNGGLWAM